MISSIAGLLLLAAGVAGAWYAMPSEETGTAEPPPGPLVRVARPEPVDRPPAVTSTGFLRDGGSVAVTSEIAGRVDEIGPAFVLGGRPEEGALLLALDRARLEAELTRARAELRAAEAERDEVQSSLDRQLELAEENFTAEATIEELRAALASAEAQVTLAESAARIARLNLEDATIEAPFDALVVEENVAPGQLLNPGTPVGRIVRADRAEVRTGLTQRHYRLLTADVPLEGRTVEIAAADGGPRREARITGVAPELSGSARTVELAIRVSDPFAGQDPFLLNGLVEVTIPLPETGTPVFSLPVAALQTGQRLWRVTGDDRLAPVDFRLERRTGDRVLVTGDLTPEMRIVLTPVATPVEGLRVRVAGDGGAADEG